MRLLIIYDLPGWAYQRRADALLKYAPRDFDVVSMSYEQASRSGPWSCDVVLLLDFALASWCRDRISRLIPRPFLVISHNNAGKPASWPGQFADWTISNNHRSWESLGRPAHSCCISNGVDTDVFRVTTPLKQRGDHVLWCGSASRALGKGYAEILDPLSRELPKHGFTCDFRVIARAARDPSHLRTAEQVTWYNRGSYVLCASEHESTPNPILEGIACGCVPVTTLTGNVAEFGKEYDGLGDHSIHNETGEIDGPLGCQRDGPANCVIVDRCVDGFLDGLLYARSHKESLSRAAVETMRGWSYGAPGNRAEYFFQLFGRLVGDGPDSVPPFSYSEKTPSEI